MARIKDSSVEAVKAAADLVAVVEERTSLRKQGARLVGRCPFHEERTPSFSVNPAQGQTPQEATDYLAGMTDRFALAY